jgi:hypothetical protein
MQQDDRDDPGRRALVVGEAGEPSLLLLQIWSRSSPSAIRARTGIVSVPTSIEASGCAVRLWYQSGLLSAPALEAKIAQSPPTAWYITGWTRSWPDFAPVLCSRSRGAPSNWPPT